MNAFPQPGAEVLLPTAAVVAIAFGAGSFWGLYAVALPIVVPIAQGSGCKPRGHALSKFPYALLATALATAAFLWVAWV